MLSFWELCLLKPDINGEKNPKWHFKLIAKPAPATQKSYGQDLHARLSDSCECICSTYLAEALHGRSSASVLCGLRTPLLISEPRSDKAWHHSSITHPRVFSISLSQVGLTGFPSLQKDSFTATQIRKCFYMFIQAYATRENLRIFSWFCSSSSNRLPK